MPDWIRTRTFRTPREGGYRMVDFPLVNSPEALLWMVQMNCIDMNAWYSRVDKPDRPDFVLFDLDPPDAGFKLAIRVAHLIREELGAARASRVYVKTSGADGIHVLVPIARRAAARANLRVRRAWRGGSRSGTQGWSRPRMAEAQARGRARRPPAERTGKDHCLRLSGAAEAGRRSRRRFAGTS